MIKKYFKKIRDISALILLLGMSSSVYSQVSAYTFSQTNGTYVPLTDKTPIATATGTSAATSMDTSVIVLPAGTIPFTFVFNGMPYTGLHVSNNGYIAFGTTGPTLNTPTAPISATTAYDGAISAWGTDINAQYIAAQNIIGEISYGVEGQAPNRVFVIEYKNFRPYYSTSTTILSRMSYQIRLFETSNKIEIVYDLPVMPTAVTTSKTVEIGLRGATNADFNNRTNTTSQLFDASTAGTTNGSKQNYTTTATPGLPAAGLTYTYTPPSCPLGVNLVAYTNGSVANHGEVTWTRYIGEPMSYMYELRTSGAPGSGSTGLEAMGMLPGNVTSKSFNTIQENVNYSFYLKTICTDTEFSNWSAPSSLYRGYCSSSSTGSTYYMTGFSTSEALVDISNLNSGFSAGGYGNFYDTHHLEVLPGSTFKFTRTITSGTYGTTIWVDSNNDFVFSDNERLYYSTTYAGALENQTVTIPASVNPGTYRMRVKVDYNATTPTACGNSSNSEAEDYKITILPVPSCIQPADMVLSNLTFDSVSVTFPAVASATNGYEYYLSTVNTNPTASTVPSGIFTGNVLNLNALTPNTQYYLWIRSNCGDYSYWSVRTDFKTFCVYAPVSASPVIVCGKKSATLNAASNGQQINWYNTATDLSSIHTGATYNTPILNESRSYYANSVTIGNPIVGLGKDQPDVLTTTTTTAGLVFNAVEPFILNSVDVFAANTASKTFNVNLLTSAGVVIQTKSFTFDAVANASAPEMKNLVLDFLISQAGSYRIMIDAPGALIRDTGVTYPFSLGQFGQISSGYTTSANTTTYYYMYNWKISPACVSPKVEVPVTVNESPELTLSHTGVTMCKYQPVTVTVATGLSNYNVYEWSPATGVSGNENIGWRFNPMMSTVYTLTLKQSQGDLCEKLIVLPVVVNAAPLVTGLTTPTDVCIDSMVPIEITPITDININAVSGTDTTFGSYSTANNIFSLYFGGTKSQMIFTVAELTAMGIEPNIQISELKFDLNSLGTNHGGVLNALSINYGHTTNEFFPNTTFINNLAVARNQADYQINVTQGLFSFVLDNPIVWNGVENLIIQFSFSNNILGTTLKGALITYTPTTNNKLLKTGSDNYTPAQILNSTTGTASTYRPNVTFVQNVTAQTTWSSSGELFTDIEGTLPYAGQNISTVYYQASQTGTITVSSNYNINTCVSTQTTTVYTIDAAMTLPNFTVSIWDAQNPTELEGMTFADLATHYLNLSQTLVFYATEQDALDRTNPIALDTPLYFGEFFAIHSIGQCTSAPVPFTVDYTLGSAQYEIKNLKYYPNPVTSEFNISSSDVIETVEVYTILGQRVLNLKPNAVQLTVSMEQLAAGSYIVKVANSNANKTIKIIKK